MAFFSMTGLPSRKRTEGGPWEMGSLQGTEPEAIGPPGGGTLPRPVPCARATPRCSWTCICPCAASGSEVAELVRFLSGKRLPVWGGISTCVAVTAVLTQCQVNCWFQQQEQEQQQARATAHVGHRHPAPSGLAWDTHCCQGWGAAGRVLGPEAGTKAAGAFWEVGSMARGNSDRTYRGSL